MYKVVAKLVPVLSPFFSQNGAWFDYFTLYKIEKNIFPPLVISFHSFMEFNMFLGLVCQLVLVNRPYVNLIKLPVATIFSVLCHVNSIILLVESNYSTKRNIFTFIKKRLQEIIVDSAIQALASYNRLLAMNKAKLKCR